MDANPYQTPSGAPAPLSPQDLSGDPEVIRNQYLKHEAQIKSIGALYYLGSVFMIFTAFTAIAKPDLRPQQIGIAIFFVLFAFLQIFIGSGLRKLKSWARVVAIILSALGLLAVPIGTIISLIVLLILASKKSIAIFTPEYRAVIAATPHIKYKSSIIFKICLIFLLVIVLIGIIAAVFSATVGK